MAVQAGLAPDSRTAVNGSGVVGAGLADEFVLGCYANVRVVAHGPLHATGGSSSRAPDFVFQTNASRTMTGQVTSADHGYGIDAFMAYACVAQEPAEPGTRTPAGVLPLRPRQAATVRNDALFDPDMTHIRR